MKFALIGHPVEGSLSPLLFGAAYGGTYAYDLVDRPNFAEAWQCFLDHYYGINVTAPYKMDAYSRCPSEGLSADARRTGAVNLVVHTPSGLMGYNTDVAGVTGALSGAGVLESLSRRPVLVVGTGGAARAAAVAAQKFTSKVFVWGRTPSTLEAFCASLGCIPYNPQSPQEAPALIIYTLPGSAPVPSWLPLEGSVVLEAEYRRPALSGCRCRQYIGGVGWLLSQAVAGYELFTGKVPSVEAMQSALEGLSADKLPQNGCGRNCGNL